MSTLQTSMKSVTRLCKQNVRHGCLRLGLPAIFPRNYTGRYQSHLGQLPRSYLVPSCRNKCLPNSEGRRIGQPHMSLSRNLQSSPTLQLCSPGNTTQTVSQDGRIGGSKEKGGDFRDILDTMVAESIKEEDMGPRNSEEMDEEDDIFVSQSGKMLLFPWRLVNTSSREELSHEEREVMIKDKTKYPSVTAILQKTMSPDSAMALLRWENFMIKKMGFPAFQKLKKEMFSEGHKLHANIGHVLLNKPEELVIEKGIEGYWNSIKEQLPELASDSPIIECHTKHPYLGYHGYADCITEYKGKPCLVEFKTSRKPKKTLNKCFDNPLQVAAYLGALNFDPRYQLQINQALLVITYKDGSPADLHVMTPELCDLYWNKWLRRLQEYRELEERQTAAQL